MFTKSCIRMERISLLALLAAVASTGALPGPCREWLQCGRSVCTSVETYERNRQQPWLSCPIQKASTGLPTAPPLGQCRLIGGTCQFTNSTLECATWVPDCDYRYTCGSVAERENNTERCGGNSFGREVPVPDTLCLPINDTCQWYNPCRYWRGHCSSPYHCGTADDYYAFIFGPQPLCARPPEGWVRPLPQGECVVQQQQCTWSNCTAYLDWCRTHWTCGTQYDEAVYLSSPPPPCPALPPGYTPPPQPGVCQFNITQKQCQFPETVPTSRPCPGGMRQATTQITGCLPTCNSYIGIETCLLPEGCECPGGTVFDDQSGNGGCIPPDQCLERADPCVLGTLICGPNQICIADSTLAEGAICIRSCGQSNGGCSDNQICIEEPYCDQCELGAVMMGHCKDLSPTDTPNVESSGSVSVGTVVGIAVGSIVSGCAILVAVAIIIILLVCNSYKRRKQTRGAPPVDHKIDSGFLKGEDSGFMYSGLKNEESISESSLEKEDLSLEKEDLSLEKEDLSLEKEDLSLEKEDLSVGFSNRLSKEGEQ